MPASNMPEPTPLAGYPALSFRFLVQFIRPGRESNGLDMLFQKVSGIGATFTTNTITEGTASHHVLPSEVKYNNLVLERGLMSSSPLSDEIDEAMTRLKFKPCDVLVILYDHVRNPIASWMFMQAYPVRWGISDFDAERNSVVIETLEMAYQRQQRMKD